MMNLKNSNNNVQNNIYIIDKPIHWTSMDIIRKMRGILKIKKIGHAGTLDPLATGVLIVCTGAMTKQINTFMDMPKEYTAEINLTAFSITDDAEGELQVVKPNRIPTQEEIIATLQKFVGSIIQVPPIYSAIKINGQRAYKKARRHEKFKMPERNVTIHNIKLVTYTWPTLTINVSCSKGTYIRSLARDIGTALHTGGYLTQLTRTAIGPYTLHKAISITKLQALQEEQVV